MYFIHDNLKKNYMLTFLLVYKLETIYKIIKYANSITLQTTYYFTLK